MAIYTIGDCLKLVEKRLDEAQKTISVRVMILIYHGVLTIALNSFPFMCMVTSRESRLTW